MNHARRLQAAACFLMVFSGVARSAESLPYFDIRLDSDGRPRPFVTDALQSALGAVSQASSESERAKLYATVPDVRVDAHEFFGTPHWVASTSGMLTGPTQDPATTPVEVVRAFIAGHAPLFEIDPVELDLAAATRDFKTTHNGVTHLTLQQQIGGIDLFGCELLANVTRQGELINVSSTLLPRPAGDFQVARPGISALDAIRAAATSVGIVMNAELAPLAPPTGVTQKQTWKNTPDFRLDEPITSELVYFPLTRSDIRPAWSVLIPEIGIGNDYEMMIDATNGQVLRRLNRLRCATTEPVTYRVYTGDSPAPMSPGTPTPSGEQPPFVPQQLVTINPEDISAININGWIDDGVNETRGNNCDAHLDLDSNNIPDLPRPSGTPYRVFDFTHDPTQAPTTAANRAAAVTQLFYLTNLYHDKLWMLGFNEAAKNFQLNNFGLGGAGNDPIQADVQDGSGANNANFSTSGSDGSTGRMQMFIYTGPNPDRDSSLDADIVFHELTHGLSTRLANNTLNGIQSDGMGEGWSDFFGLSLNAEAPDDPHANYAAVNFVTFGLNGMTTNCYFGIRRFPYSTDFNKNPATYADIDNAQVSYPPSVPSSPGVGSFISTTANQEHNVGTVWCTILWEARANLIGGLGFAGNDTMMRLVVDGLKMQPPNPNFLQARDAIIQADLVHNGGANVARLWRAFAKRGCGPLATSPSGSTSSGIVESFALYTFNYPDGLPFQLIPGESTTFRVQAGSVTAAAQPIPDTGELFYSVNGGEFVSVAMSQIEPNLYNAVIPPMNCLDLVRYYVRVGTQDGYVTDPPVAPAQSQTAASYQGTSTVFHDDFELNEGWTVVNTNLVTGGWVRVDPNGSYSAGLPAQPEDDNSPFGTRCFVTGQGPINGLVSAQDVDGGPTVLTSPLINLSEPGQYALSYARWFYCSAGTARTLRVEISNNDGVNWTPVEIVPGTTTASWITKSWSINSIISPTDQMRLRFITEDNPNTTTTEGGVDDVFFTRMSCEPSPVCLHGDVNGDAMVDGQDVARFVTLLTSGGTGTPTEICAGDLEVTPDGLIDTGDVDDFVSCLLTGGC